MRIVVRGTKTARAAAFLASFVCPVLSHAQSTTFIPGYMNAKTGVFRALPSPSLAAAGTLYTGTFDVTITITLASTIPTTQPIVCSAELLGASAGGVYTQDVTFQATRNGNTATCTETVPYAWTLGTSPTYSFSYTIETVSSSTSVPLRLLATTAVTGAPVPPKGTTTKLTAAATI
jgi:hypothetical protein